MALFIRLHDDLFRPLAGPNRHVFNAILARLHELFFGGTIFATQKVLDGDLDQFIEARLKQSV